MAISSVNTNPTASSPLSNPLSQIASNAVAPVVDKARSSIDTIPSTIVTLSAQAQKLSQSQTSASSTQPQSQNSNQVNTAAKENVESVPKEANEASGIQFMEGETRSGRISTYA